MSWSHLIHTKMSLIVGPVPKWAQRHWSMIHCTMQTLNLVQIVWILFSCNHEESWISCLFLSFLLIMKFGKVTLRLSNCSRVYINPIGFLFILSVSSFSDVGLILSVSLWGWWPYLNVTTKNLGDNLSMALLLVSSHFKDFWTWTKCLHGHCGARPNIKDILVWTLCTFWDVWDILEWDQISKTFRCGSDVSRDILDRTFSRGLHVFSRCFGQDQMSCKMWALMTGLPLNSSVTSDKILNLSVPQFFIMKIIIVLL